MNLKLLIKLIFDAWLDKSKELVTHPTFST